MKQHHYVNGDEGAGSESGGDDEEQACEELSLADAAAPARALNALNALRKSRQHYDVVLVAGGVEVAAHRAVLAAASPYLLEALGTGAGAAPYRVEEVDGDALRALVEYAYTGSLRVRDAGGARRLYRAAWRLRVETARAHLASRLLRRLAPHDCLAVRALPGLAADQLEALDEYIAANFEEVCSSGALAALPQIRISVMRESSAADGGETPLTVADAALAWLRDRAACERDFDELCSRHHLVFVDARGALRDCGELPDAAGDAPELQQYRREAAARRRQPPTPTPQEATPAPRVLPGSELGARAAGAECGVLAARRAAGGATKALLQIRGRLAAASALWSGVAAGGGGVARGGRLAGGERVARLAAGRCAHGAAALGGALVVCGGYDRARVLRSVETYSPARNAWSAGAEMRRERARFPAARLRGAVYLVGGSDGHVELDSVEAYDGVEWRARARLPAAVSHAACAADEAGGALYAAGGWAGGAYLRRCWRYSAEEDAWSEAPALSAARAQCAALVWEGAVWAVGGCDAWHCLASAERLALDETARGAGWTAGPALPSARRSMGGAAWRGRLVLAGGSDGAASLRRTDWLETGEEGAPAWRAGPALRRARAGPGLAVLGDTLYAAGGFDGKEFLACVECLSRPDGEWTSLCAPPSPAAALGPALGPAPAPDAERAQEAVEKPGSEVTATMTSPSPATSAS